MSILIKATYRDLTKVPNYVVVDVDFWESSVYPKISMDAIEFLMTHPDYEEFGTFEKYDESIPEAYIPKRILQKVTLDPIDYVNCYNKISQEEVEIRESMRLLEEKLDVLQRDRSSLRNYCPLKNGHFRVVDDLYYNDEGTLRKIHVQNLSINL